MSKYTQGIQDLRSLVSRFRGVLSLADELEHLGSIENAVAEANARLKAVQDQIAAETERSSQSIVAAHQEAETIRSGARQDAAVVTATVEGEAKRAKDTADAYYRERGTHAAGLVTKAEADAQAIKDGVASHQAELERLAGQISTLKSELTSILNQIERAKADRQSLRDSINLLHKTVAGT